MNFLSWRPLFDCVRDRQITSPFRIGRPFRFRYMNVTCAIHDSTIDIQRSPPQRCFVIQTNAILGGVYGCDTLFDSRLRRRQRVYDRNSSTYVDCTRESTRNAEAKNAIAYLSSVSVLEGSIWMSRRRARWRVKKSTSVISER